MTTKELETLMRHIADCNDYLNGRKHTVAIAEIAGHAARRAVIERKQNLYDRLIESGLKLEIEA